ncbi:hypothetical protein PTTG_08467 [Puccinia triticina 1-1 BBBD Race 1]|uniref:Uncharacterized protein n=2 Tax=Puccinia triticina TaxID=208348 RepID=A0A180G825_PUCT1|nr:uncharacterized protein PtA15_18A273 [Puccinia triticina]OAV88629.1 hypothetical protein PTTG_08467 [Puccinia triticina 1-1 BBBD Race 1]WAQ93215.1 hypothetical protein PtA15_18A273 [Puccinia triticina]
MMVTLDNRAQPPGIPTTHPVQQAVQEPIDLLILGAGWSAGFLISYLDENQKHLTYRTTTTCGGGRYNSIKFKFDPTADLSKSRKEEEKVQESTNQFESLPDARSILISFPVKNSGASSFLVHSYLRSRSSSSLLGNSNDPNLKDHFVNFIQLGSTGIFDGGPTLSSQSSEEKNKTKEEEEGKMIWIDRHSKYDKTNARAESEDELLQLNGSKPISKLEVRTTVMNLSGLWGGSRSIRNYVGKVAPSIEALSMKTSVHMIHGLDVARAIVAVIDRFDLAAGQRWILTDQRVYDWWDLASAWGLSALDNAHSHQTIGPQAHWVNQLMQEHNIRALPRPPSALGRALDSRQFWDTFGLTPVRARMELLA